MPTEWKQIIHPNSVYDAHGLKERTLDTWFTHLRIGFSVNTNKDDDWAARHALSYGGFDSPKWRREQGIEYDAYSGQRIWPMISRDHDLKLDIKGYTLYRILDQGIRHPTVCIWVAVNAKGDRHVYREYYAVNKSIAMNCRAIIDMTPANELIAMNLIDPSTAKRNPETLESLISVYEKNGLYCYKADNSFAGYDTVATSLLSTIARKAIRTGEMPKHLAELSPTQDQLLSLAAKPALTFDLRFASRCFGECANLRWADTKSDVTQHAKKEKPVDINDDGSDCVRYAVQSHLGYKLLPRDLTVLPFAKMSQLMKAKKKQNEIALRNENRSRYYG